MRPWTFLAFGLALLATVATQPLAAASPSQAVLDDAVRLGAVATLAPLCGLRPEGWAADLRRATIHGATGAARPDDPALRAAPGSHLVVGALSFAETDALERFAAAPSEECQAMAIDPDLIRADTLVRDFQSLKQQIKPTS